MRSARSLLVTGDVQIDHCIYEGDRTQSYTRATRETQSFAERGGAYLIYQILAGFNETIRLKHLEALLDFDAAAMKPDESRVHPLPRGWKGIDTLGILSRTESVLESIERTVLLILSRDEGQASSVELTDHLYHRIIEFVSLLLQAVYYENPETLSQIKGLGRCLESFIETLRIDPAQGLQFWQNEVSPQFRNVQQLIMNDIDSNLTRY
jgi:hypothetical protein